MSGMFSLAVVAYLDQRMTLCGAALERLTADYRRLQAEHGSTDALLIVDTWITQQIQGGADVGFFADMLTLAVSRMGTAGGDQQ